METIIYFAVGYISGTLITLILSKKK